MSLLRAVESTVALSSSRRPARAVQHGGLVDLGLQAKVEETADRAFACKYADVQQRADLLHLDSVATTPGAEAPVDPSRWSVGAARVALAVP